MKNHPIIGWVMAVGFLAGLALLVYWAEFDTSPVLDPDLNTSTVHGPVVVGEPLLVHRHFRKFRDDDDCSLVVAEHWLVAEPRTMISLQRRITGVLQRRAGPSKLALAFNWPEIARAGTYWHEVRLVYRCNPLTEQTIIVQSNKFEAVPP